ncbi:MAG: N-methyl-D-aspartate receptor NMDAR2C subunit [Planctomycetes bacterium]|nr:N-methyl-D-aspartate receptor NMDAR2C subunit [Planctomycetota bacterium]
MNGLRLRWPVVWRRLGASLTPDVSGLLQRWAEPHRRYHTTAHLAHCLATYDRNPLRDARVELVLWFHDAIYEPRASDNEERSAELARTVAVASGLTSETIDVVVGCILATRHREPPADAAQALTLDVDLAILGETRLRFDRYDAAIRAEYAWVPEETYRRERGRILAGFARRDDLFTTSWFRRRYGRPAQANLLRAVRRLEVAHE